MFLAENSNQLKDRPTANFAGGTEVEKNFPVLRKDVESKKTNGHAFEQKTTVNPFSGKKAK